MVGNNDPPTGSTGPNQKYECPKCGDEYANLPCHLRACTEGEQ